MPLVAGVDSSTQSCKVVVRDAHSGALLRSGSAPHPPGCEVDPQHWWTALQRAVAAAGGLDDVAAVSVAGQQHGMVCLDAEGRVVRDALLWNDTRSAAAGAALVAELPGGAQGWADAIGSVPVASFTVTKLRWLAEHEPANAGRTAAVCLPHDWLTWQLGGGTDLGALGTDRGDASGTGYWSPQTGEYRLDLLELAMGARPAVPQVRSPAAVAGTLANRPSTLLAAGTGDNAAAALGVGCRRGDLVVSVGTSAVVSATAERPTADGTGAVAGFADATGVFLPLVCTLNGTGVLHATARVLGVDLQRLSALALSVPSGADGLVFVPYLAGERTPNLPEATGALHGLTYATATPAHLARAAFEGLLCGLADGIDALRECGVPVRRAILIGGGARAEALRRLAPAVLALPVLVPGPGEHVADGAARQAAWALAGGAKAPPWELSAGETLPGEPDDSVRRRYADVRRMVADRIVAASNKR